MESFVTAKHVSFISQPKGALLSRLAGREKAAYPVLEDVNLQLDHGAWVTIFGASGSGKTTLLRLLTGVLAPTKGTMSVNGRPPQENKQAAAGYVDSEELENASDTVRDTLQTFAKAHGIKDAASRIGHVADIVGFTSLLDRKAEHASKTERLKINIGRAILSKAPLILLDDVADELGAEEVKRILGECCEGRTVLITTRSTATAEKLELPIILLHHGKLAHMGTCEEIANTVSCPRVLDAWIENLKYDVLRRVRSHPGVTEVRLLATDRFAGQRLRITLQSSRYLPSIYDIISQTTLVKVNELPPSLTDILTRL